MKYKTVKVASHPRSGSHWVMRLIDMNFFDGKDYLKHYGGHPFGNEPRAKGYFKPAQAVFYTYRDLNETADSVFRMRHRFGLDEDDFEKFLITPIKKMYNKNLQVEAVRDTLDGKKMNVDEVDWLFRDRNETVIQYMQKHINSWRTHHSRRNFLMLSYNDLANDFDGTMLQVAQFLGSNKTKFVDEHQRVGWREKQDNAWKKPGTNSDD